MLSTPNYDNTHMIPTIIALIFDQDNEAPQAFPSLMTETQLDLSSADCNCKKALRRFHPEQNIISDGIFELRIICKSIASVTAAIRLQHEHSDASAVQSRKLPEIRRFCFALAACCDCSKDIIVQVKSPPASPEPIRDFERFDPQPGPPTVPNASLDRKRINKALAQCISKPLKRLMKEGTQRPGHMYILSTPSMPNHLKIGYSRRHPQVRFQELTQCYKSATLVAFTSVIPQALRVEQLVHAELALQRYVDKCGKCNTNHGKWFAVSRELAIQVIRRWAVWLACQPYEDSGVLGTLWTGRLRPGLIVSLRPGVDHFTSREGTWQTWVDQRRVRGKMDYSDIVEITEPKEVKSPFVDI